MLQNVNSIQLLTNPFHLYIDVDECAGHARDVCPYLTECVNTVGSFICDCNEPGYLADGNSCVGNIITCIYLVINFSKMFL